MMTIVALGVLLRWVAELCIAVVKVMFYLLALALMGVVLAGGLVIVAVWFLWVLVSEVWKSFRGSRPGDSPREDAEAGQIATPLQPEEFVNPTQDEMEQYFATHTR